MSTIETVLRVQAQRDAAASELRDAQLAYTLSALSTATELTVAFTSPVWSAPQDRGVLYLHAVLPPVPERPAIWLARNWQQGGVEANVEWLRTSQGTPVELRAVHANANSITLALSLHVQEGTYRTRADLNPFAAAVAYPPVPPLSVGAARPFGLPDLAPWLTRLGILPAYVEACRSYLRAESQRLLRVGAAEIQAARERRGAVRAAAVRARVEMELLLACEDDLVDDNAQDDAVETV